MYFSFFPFHFTFFYCLNIYHLHVLFCFSIKLRDLDSEVQFTSGLDPWPDSDSYPCPKVPFLLEREVSGGGDPTLTTAGRRTWWHSKSEVTQLVETCGIFLENTTKMNQKAGQGPKLPLLTTYDLRGCEHHTLRGCQPLESLG